MQSSLSIRREVMHACVVFSMVLSLVFSFVAFSGLMLSDFEGAKNIVRFVAAGLGFLALVMSGGIPIMCFFFVGAGLFWFLLNGNPLVINLVFIVFFTFIVRSVRPLYLSRICFGAACAGCGLHLVLLAFGYANVESYDVAGRVRNAFGFSNPNQLAALYLSLFCTALFYGFYRENPWGRRLAAMGCLTALYFIFFADSRTCLVAMAILLIWRVGMVVRGLARLSRLLGLLLPVFGVSVSAFLTTRAALGFNDLLSFRPYFFNMFVEGRSTLDILIGWDDVRRLTIDNGYIALWSSIGLPMTFFVLLIIVYRMTKVPVIFIPILGAGLIISITESILIRPELPLSMLFFGLIFNRRASMITFQRDQGV